MHSSLARFGQDRRRMTGHSETIRLFLLDKAGIAGVYERGARFRQLPNLSHDLGQSCADHVCARCAQPFLDLRVATLEVPHAQNNFQLGKSGVQLPAQ